MSKNQNAIQGDRLVPYSKEAEDAVIASCLIDPEVYPLVRSIVSSEDFHTLNAKESFAAMEDLWPGLDQLTVYEAVKSKVKPEYLTSIVSVLPTSVNAEYYAKIVYRESYRRKLITASGKIAAIAYQGESDSEDLFLEAQELIYATEPQSKEDLLGGPEIAENILTMVSDRLLQKEGAALYFGFKDIDRITGGGMYGGNLIVVGARPGVGKSQFVIEVGYDARLNQDRAVMVASAEMTLNEWCEREIAIATGISVEDQRKGKGIDKEDIPEYANFVSQQEVYWLKEPVTISRIVNKARVLKRTKGLDLLIVDYIQLLCDSVTKEHGSSVREKVGYISRSLKRLAKELDIRVLLAAQLNREIEHRKDKTPLMSDIKEAGDIEQDADIILLLHRPSLYEDEDDAQIDLEEENDKQQNVMRVYIPKIRQLGKVAMVKLVWREGNHRYGDISHE